MCKSCTSTQIVQEMHCFLEKWHKLHTFCTTAGCDGRDKPQLWFELLLQFNSFISKRILFSICNQDLKMWEIGSWSNLHSLDSNQIMEIGFCFVLTENFVIWKLHHANQLFLFDFLGKISIRLTILTNFCSLRRTIAIN